MGILVSLCAGVEVGDVCIFGCCELSYRCFRWCRRLYRLVCVSGGCAVGIGR